MLLLECAAAEAVVVIAAAVDAEKGEVSEGDRTPLVEIVVVVMRVVRQDDNNNGCPPAPALIVGPAMAVRCGVLDADSEGGGGGVRRGAVNVPKFPCKRAAAGPVATCAAN